MYIAKGYFDTKFKQSFKKGDVVPTEIAEVYSRYVTEEEGELLVETPSAVEVIVKEEVEKTEEVKEVEKTEEVKEVEKTEKTEEVEDKKSKKAKKKGFWN